MLDRNIRGNPCPAQAAEVRENIIPRTPFVELFQPSPCETDVLKVRSDIHDGMYASPALNTLFLHEDLITRILLYQRNLKAYRLNDIKAGQGDPGRPAYNEVLGVNGLPSISSARGARKPYVSTALLQQTLSRMNEQEPLIPSKAAPASNQTP